MALRNNHKAAQMRGFKNGFQGIYPLAG